jgi:hypothetical protein
VASMKRAEVAQYWEANAETWTRHARAGYDIYRDGLNTDEEGTHERLKAHLRSHCGLSTASFSAKDVARARGKTPAP